MNERDIESYLTKRVKAIGGEVRKVQWVGRRGAPDRLVMLPMQRLAKSIDCAWCNPRGRAIWVELKAPGKKAEAHQLREHDRMRAMGQTVVIIDSLQAVEAMLS
jgi:hypothetical protein